MEKTDKIQTKVVIFDRYLCIHYDDGFDVYYAANNYGDVAMEECKLNDIDAYDQLKLEIIDDIQYDKTVEQRKKSSAKAEEAKERYLLEKLKAKYEVLRD